MISMLKFPAHTSHWHFTDLSFPCMVSNSLLINFHSKSASRLQYTLPNTKLRYEPNKEAQCRGLCPKVNLLKFVCWKMTKQFWMPFLYSVRRCVPNFWKLPVCTTHTWIPIDRNTGLILYPCYVQTAKSALCIQLGLNSVQVLCTNQIHGTCTAMEIISFLFLYCRTKVTT